MAKRKKIKMNPSERIKKSVDDYLDKCFPEKPVPRQEIEIRLAVYAGMHLMFGMMLEILDTPGGEEKQANLLEQYRSSIMERALELNKQRQTL